MNIFSKIIIIFLILPVFSCSSSYKKLTKASFSPPNEFSKHLFTAYKEKADFEAKEMHDWNSAKLYSDKALNAASGKSILPEKIEYWKISPEKSNEIIAGYNNLMVIYNDAIKIDPFNLAKAISSLDCWAEQQEESWQIWDIKKCRDDFLNAMHLIYEKIEKDEKNHSQKFIEEQKKKNIATIVTKDNNNNILHIVYFDFDKSNLSLVSKNKIIDFVKKNRKIINKLIIVGHTDTVGTDDYNKLLSLERADAVKKILIGIGIKSDIINILGKGEKELMVLTKDEIPHPVNRRAEISLLN